MNLTPVTFLLIVNVFLLFVGALMDSISADLMSRAGASDAASALKLVAGASVQNGKSAVIRGLPDRYVSSQMNGVRLPTADEDKRAVELDQFPSAVIESIQVSKTFTPDQQGDASGGAVNVVLKSVPEENTIKVSISTSFALFSGFNRSSTVPAGSASNAASVGANTVNGPSPLSVSTNPAALTAATSVLNLPAPTAVSTMSPA